VGEPASISVRLRNVSDHAVSLLPAWNEWIALWVDDAQDADNAPLDSPLSAASPLLAGEQRTLTATFTPQQQLIGTSTMRAVFMEGQVMFHSVASEYIDGIAPVTVSVIPPGWTPQQALDPAMGQWNVTMSADAPEVNAGGSVTVHATVTNVGNKAQNTAAFGALAFSCDRGGIGYSENASRVAPVTLAPGQTQTFSFDYRPNRDVAGAMSCFLGMTYKGGDSSTWPHDGLVTDAATITVLPEGSTIPPTATSTVPTAP
jgi:hypothetical protein